MKFEDGAGAFPIAVGIYGGGGYISIEKRDMGEKIQPALSAEEWAKRAVNRAGQYLDPGYGEEAGILFTGADDQMLGVAKSAWLPRDLPALIALANAALRDDDPRKITREKIEVLREVAVEIEAEAGSDADVAGTWSARIVPSLNELADALESYLPPEGR